MFESLTGRVQCMLCYYVCKPSLCCVTAEPRCNFSYFGPVSQQPGVVAVGVLLTFIDLGNAEERREPSVGILQALAVFQDSLSEVNWVTDPS